MKIVINACFGGFGLSHLAQKIIADRKGIEIKFTEFATKKEMQLEDIKEGMIVFSNLPKPSRTDPDLIDVVELLGDAVNTSCSLLKVVEIPDDVNWVIEEYDGREWISEKHGMWGGQG